MKIYTRTGDDGTTSLVGGRRVSKTDVRLEAYGCVDELNANIGLLAAFMSDGSDLQNLRWIQNKLFCIGGALATDTDTTKLPDSCHISSSDVTRLESMIDAASEGLPQQKAFILPGGCQSAAVCHMARTVCRRAERRILQLDSIHKVNSDIIIFVNRLSDYLFVMSRRLNFLSSTPEIFWGE